MRKNRYMRRIWLIFLLSNYRSFEEKRFNWKQEKLNVYKCTAFMYANRLKNRSNFYATDRLLKVSLQVCITFSSKIHETKNQLSLASHLLLPIGFCPRIWHWKVTWFPCTALVIGGGCRTKHKFSFFTSVEDDSFVIDSTISLCFFFTFPLSIVPPDTSPVKLFFRCGRTENSVYSRSFCCPPSKLGNSPPSWNSQSLLVENRKKLVLNPARQNLQDYNNTEKMLKRSYLSRNTWIPFCR